MHLWTDKGLLLFLIELWHLDITIGSEMAESKIIVKDYKFPLSLGEETIYKNWTQFMILMEKAR